MAEIRVAFAPQDARAAAEIMEELRALGYQADPAPLKSTPLAPSALAQTLVLWSRHAAAEPRLRRAARAAMVARLDHAPTPRAALARVVDLADLVAPAPPKSIAASTQRAAAPIAAAPIADAAPPAKKRGVVGVLIATVIGLALTAGCAAAVAYLSGWVAL